MCSNGSIVRKWLNESLKGNWLTNIFSTNRIKPLVYVVDMSSPNIAKPFHVGHLRSTLVGQVTANLLELAGHKVYRINYLGDWGGQFGLLARGFHDYGDWDILNKDDASNDRLMHLYDVYVKCYESCLFSANQNKDPSFINASRALFVSMETGDKEALDFWKTARDVSICSFKELYSLFNIRFDSWDGESMYSTKCIQLREQWESRGLLSSSQGTTGIWGKENQWRALFKTDGSSLYLTRDVAAAVDRVQRYSPDKLIYIVEEGQREHFLGLKDALTKLNHENIANIIEHVPFGRISGMRTRDGNAVFVTDLINEGMQLSRNILLHPTSKLRNATEDVKTGAVRNFALSSLIINFLSKRRVTNFKFKWEHALRLKGNEAAPYLHYQHARLCTLESQFGPSFGDFNDSIDLEILDSCEDATRTIESLKNLRERLVESSENLDSEPFLTGLFQFAHTLGSVNKTMRIKNVEIEIARPRFFLLCLCRDVLRESMVFLGVNPMKVM